MSLVYRYTKALSVIALLTFSACSNQSSEFEQMFNGKDLSGWEGGERWSVRDGAITGQTMADNPVAANTFLIWQGAQPGNFELRFSFRLTAQNDKGWGNSGVQYRSKRIGDEGFVIGGYQADIDSTGKYTGMLYEEKGRGLLMNPGEKIRITAKTPDSKKKATVEVLGIESTKDEILNAYNIGDWNDFVVIANGNHIQHFINGVLTADVIDDDKEGASMSGLIALQLHKGEPMTIQFKDIEIREIE